MKRRILGAILFFLPSFAFADERVPAGSTSVCVGVQVKDSSSSTGAGLANLAFDSASLSCLYRRQGSSAVTAITLASSTLGTYTSGAFKEMDDGDEMKGWYELCLPDAVVAAGASEAYVQCKGATNMAQMDLRIELVSPNSFGYDGKLTSESTTTLGLASGGIDADDQFAYQAELIAFDTNGSLAATSCIIDSDNAGDTVVTAEDISALVVGGGGSASNYIIRPNSACRNLRPATAGRTLVVDGTGHGSINWGDISNPTTTQNLSGTTVIGSGGSGASVRRW